MKAVLITDVIQSLLMFTCISIVIIKGLTLYTVTEVYEAALNSGRLEFFK